MTSTQIWPWSLPGIFPTRAIARAICRHSSAYWSTPILPWVDRCSRCSPTDVTWRICSPVWSPNWPVQAWSLTASSEIRPRAVFGTVLSTSRPRRSLRSRPSGRGLMPAARRCAASLSPSCRSRVPRTRSRASATCAKTAPGHAIRCPRPCSRSSRRPAASFARRPIAACSSWPTHAW